MPPGGAPSGGPAQLVVLLFAFFGIPKLMAHMPDFDPLMLVMGMFFLLAGAQHLGLVPAPEGHSAGPGRSSPDGPSSQQQWQRGGGASSRRGGSDPDPAEQDSKSKAETMLLEAERCLAQNSYSKAQNLASKVVDLDPENVRAWELLATAQKWEGNHKEASDTVRKARDIYEVDSETLKALAQELETSNANPAVAAAVSAAESEAKGEEFIARRQYDLAAECFDRAAAALEQNDADKPGRLRVLRRQAECAQQLQDWTTCRRAATGVLEEEPNDAICLLQRAAANEALERFKAALEDARKLLAMDPKNAAANRLVHNCQQALRS